MPFEKGHSGNKEGRPKGSLNKKTETWNTLSTKFVDVHSGRIDEYLDELWTTNKGKYTELYLSLIRYYRPTLKSVDNIDTNSGSVIINLGSGEVEPITGMQINNLEPEKKEAYDRLTTTGELLPSDFTHSIKFTSTPKEVDQDKPEPKKVLKITEDIKPIEDIKPKVKKVGKYIVM